MKKKRNRGGLIKTNIKTSDIEARKAPDGQYRVIGVSSNPLSVWVEGTYTDFKSAKLVVDKQASDEVKYYVHSDSNRILYRG